MTIEVPDEFEEMMMLADDNHEISLPNFDILSNYFCDTVTGYKAKLVNAGWDQEDATEMAKEFHSNLVFKVLS